MLNIIKYSSLIDDLPAYLGGRSNSWRRLNLKGLNLFKVSFYKNFILIRLISIHFIIQILDLPRHTIFYDVIDYVLNKKLSHNLANKLSFLMKASNNQDVQIKQIQMLKKRAHAASEFAEIGIKIEPSFGPPAHQHPRLRRLQNGNQHMTWMLRKLQNQLHLYKLLDNCRLFPNNRSEYCLIKS